MKLVSYERRARGNGREAQVTARTDATTYACIAGLAADCGLSIADVVRCVLDVSSHHWDEVATNARWLAQQRAKAE